MVVLDYFMSQAIMMMMENYEELFERCFQVTYFTPVKCGIFKTTELIESSLSKANNIFLQKRGYQRPKNKPNRTCSDRQKQAASGPEGEFCSKRLGRHFDLC